MVKITYWTTVGCNPLEKNKGKAMMLLNIHAYQLSILRLAIHHIAVIADEETRASPTTVLLSVFDNISNKINKEPKKNPNPITHSFFEQKEIG